MTTKTLTHWLAVASLCLACATAKLASAWAQEERPVASEVNSPDNEVSFDRSAMMSELRRLAEVCERIGLSEQAEISRHWEPPVRHDQLLLYLPGVSTSQPTEDANFGHWQDAFLRARRNYAGYLFEQARAQLKSQQEDRSFCTLWHVLREDPSHSEAKRILGPLATAARVRPQLRLSNAPHEKLGWAAKTYSRVTTPHFTLTTRADRRESVLLATQLEEFFALWSQVFYELWAAPGKLEQRFASSSSTAFPWDEPPHSIEVVLLRDRQEYLDTLGASEASIGLSVGYYSPQVQMSFFYPAPDMIATLFHELTHQLFIEATQLNVSNELELDGGLWMIEGIAMHMESLAERNDYWTLGGIDSPRMQTARYRAVRDGFWPEWNDFAAGNMERWKRDPQLATLYSHAVGLTHVFLDGLISGDSSREAYLRGLVAAYRGNSDGRELLVFLGDTEEAAKNRYQDALTVTEEQLLELDATGYLVAELVLSGSLFTPQAWQTLSRQTQLQWLDLSFSNVAAQDLRWLPQANKLVRLSLEGTRLEGEALKWVRQVPELRELDLADCAIDDADLQELAGHRKLQTLWLTNTRVTDKSLKTLSSLPALKRCDVRGTQIQESSWLEFAKQRGW
ncbi:MAG: hypothetical protein KDB22_05390 [Planctomycetales bacterium]|nr:hypothetical protein [Planctomycetales bacterium]